MDSRSSKIFFFSEFFYPEDNSTAQYITEIARVASSVFCDATEVFCVAKNKSSNYIDKIKVHGIPAKSFNKNRLSSRILGFLCITGSFFFQAVRKVRRRDVVFCVTNPAFSILMLSVIKKIIKFHFCILCYDVFPENLIAAGVCRHQSLSYRLLKRLFDFSYKQAELVIVPGRDMKEKLIAKGVASGKIIIIPNWADSKKIHAVSAHRHVAPQKTFLFAGNIGRTQGIKNLIDAIAEANISNCSFVFAGDGAMRPLVTEAVEAIPEKHISYIGQVDSQQMNTVLSQADIAIITLCDKMKGIGVPSKSYFYMAAGLPLLYIGDQESEIALVIKQHDLGFVVPPGDPSKLSHMLEEIIKTSSSELTMMGCRARTVLCAHYDKEQALCQYKNVFKKLLEETRNL